ncbi:cytochrome P450 [Phellopilus nigrolimitatus]|nr:cytochrome P450 [Phellopilus nigrolimitatus]
MPPSPPTDFLIGHARKIPRRESWKTYSEWMKTCGDVIFAHALGHSMVILNSVEAARDLLEKRSMFFSDRPYVPIIYLVGWSLSLPILRYGSRFRKHRRMMQQHFGAQAISSFRLTQEIEVRKFLLQLLERPEGFLGHIKRHAFNINPLEIRLVAGTLVMITYGHEIISDDDAYVDLVERAMTMTSSLGSVGTTVIDLFPFLRHVPAWLPGMSLKRRALETRKAVDEVTNKPFNEVRTKKDAGTALPSISLSLLDEYEGTNVVDLEHEEDMKIFSTTIYNAGSDTTKSSLTAFFMLMTLHPKVAQRAQEEIDTIIGMERLPTLDDRSNLPYIDCILKELFRVHPPLPLGVPHQCTQTDDYRGWTIEAGTMVIPNIWYEQMMRDETFFPNPDVFSPERHAGKTSGNDDATHSNEVQDMPATSVTEDDPSSIVFGFGRRVCPGKLFAESMLWMTMANVLACFAIRPCSDPLTGVEELPKWEFENETPVSPKPFRCTILPRSEEHALMIRDEAHK